MLREKNKKNLCVENGTKEVEHFYCCYKMHEFHEKKNQNKM